MTERKVDFREVVKLVDPAEIPPGWNLRVPTFLRSAAPLYQAELEYLDWMSKVNSKFVLGTLIGAGTTKNIATGIPSGLAAAGKLAVNYDYSKSKDRVATARTKGEVYVANPLYGVARLIRSTPDQIVREVGDIVRSELNDLKGSVIFGKPVISSHIFDKVSIEESEDEASK